MPSQHSNVARPIGWHSRGYLPHFDAGELTQTLTFRLFDTIPQDLLRAWREELAMLPTDEAERERRKRIEHYLDRGYGECWLKEPQIAEMVENAFLFFDGERYRLHAWSILSNHGHVALTPLPESSRSSIVFSLKSFTAKEANKLLGRAGVFWAEDYFDRYIRDERHYQAAIDYIEDNPKNAGLCARREEWRWSSAWWRKRGGKG
jgi:REP element-mobilizing transposase RayT